MSAIGFPGSARGCLPFRFLSVLLTSSWLVPLFLVSPSVASAANTYTVTTNTDDYSGTPTTVTGAAANCPANATAAGCTLRDAITAANANPGSTIVFAVTGTNTLSFVLPVIAVNTTITGPGANVLTIAGGYQQFSISGGSTVVTIYGLTLANANNTVVGTGLLPSYAGAIYNLASTLTVDHVVFANNTTGQPTLPGEGGGILNNEGNVTVNDCTFIGNSTQYNGLGGAITSIGTLTIQGSSFIDNTASAGSAVYSLSGLSISDSTFTGNYASEDGAVTFTSGTMTVKNSTFVGNTDPIGPNVGTDINNDGYPGTLLVYNSLFGNPSGCVTTSTPSDCPVNGVNGNIVEPASSLKLAALGYYGGPTETMLPLPGSPAHCAGATSNFPGVDQRGFGADVACGAGLVDAGSVQTSYFAVTTASDDAGSPATSCGATCTFRDAVTAALADGNGDITFASGLSTITLGAALPAIDIPGSIDIMGPGANLLSVSGNNTYPVFNIEEGTLDIAGLAIANGKAASGGGAVNNTGGVVTLSDVFLNNNSAGGNGGAVANAGALLVSDSTFSGNKAASGSAIYNTGAVIASYSTFAGNTAASAGGIYNAGGATFTAVNSTFAGNSGAAAPGIDNAGALMLANSILDSAAECAGTACPASGHGNAIGATHLASLANYGGQTPTVLPQPGSSAICAGSAALIPLFTVADQRGFPNDNITYAGYSSTAPCVDAGAVQTSYTSVQFVGTQPYVATANTPGQTPPIIVSVTENGQNIGGVPVTLAFTGAGTASGLTATTLANTGATFSSLVVTEPSTTDTLSVSMPVIGAYVLSAGPASLTVNPQPAVTPVITFTVPNHTYGDAPFMVSATSTSPAPITFSVVSGPATIVGSTVTLTGAGNVVLQASQGPIDNFTASSQNASFSVAKAAQTITFTGLPATATYPGAGPYTLNAKASSGLAVSYAVTGPASLSGATLTITGTGTVVVTASQSGNANYLAGTSVSQTIVVTGGFTIVPLPSSETVYAGGIALFLLDLQAKSGFSGNVTLSCSGGPSGSTCLDFPMTVSFYNGTALALSGIFFPANTKPGTYTVTFTGVSGSVTSSATATFTVISLH
jgi:hypothetical protein